VPLVIDHCGRVVPDDRSGTGIDAIRRLLGKGNTWVKLSAPYLNAVPGAPNYDDAIKVGRILVEENEDRIVWGSDWPHVTEVDRRPLPASLTDFAVACLGNGERMRKALVYNPQSLYGF
jgi:predicted TIM-barrel fold metal-dependent hydrolase